MPETEQDILQKVIQGDRKAYAEIVNRHQDKAMTLAMRLLRNRQDAEEAVQDAFVRAFHAVGRFEWRSSFSTWFYRIVYNVCLTTISRRDGRTRTTGPEVGDDDIPDVEDPSPAPDVNFESAEIQRMILEEIDRLPGQYGALLTLFFVQELSHAEIVELTGMPLGTVKVRLFRGRALLRTALKERLGPTEAWGLSGMAATVV